MPVFEYTARNASTGQILKGTIDVATRDDVLKHIKQQKMIMVNVREQPKQITFASLKRRGIRTRDIVIFTRQFATMINSRPCRM
jgi:type IV pilus assembly protein PilC